MQTTIDKATAAQEVMTQVVMAAKELANKVDDLVTRVDELVGDAVEEETGDIRWAAERLREGKKVKRRCWQGLERISCPVSGLIDVRHPNGQCGGWWMPRSEDLLAEDWVVVHP